MPVLPLVDLFILLGSGSFAIGALLKVIAMTTYYRPTILGLTSTDFALVTVVCFAFALTLVARTWLKLHEPRLLQLRSRLRAEEAHRRARELELAAANALESQEAPLATTRKA
jgi:small-conductance mechanosensitive channel